MVFESSYQGYAIARVSKTSDMASRGKMSNSGASFRRRVLARQALNARLRERGGLDSNLGTVDTVGFGINGKADVSDSVGGTNLASLPQLVNIQKGGRISFQPSRSGLERVLPGSTHPRPHVSGLPMAGAVQHQRGEDTSPLLPALNKKGKTRDALPQSESDINRHVADPEYDIQSEREALLRLETTRWTSKDKAQRWVDTNPLGPQEPPGFHQEDTQDLGELFFLDGIPKCRVESNTSSTISRPSQGGRRKRVRFGSYKDWVMPEENWPHLLS